MDESGAQCSWAGTRATKWLNTEPARLGNHFVAGFREPRYKEPAGNETAEQQPNKSPFDERSTQGESGFFAPTTKWGGWECFFVFTPAENRAKFWTSNTRRKKKTRCHFPKESGKIRQSSKGGHNLLYRNNVITSLRMEVGNSLLRPCYSVYIFKISSFPFQRI